MLSPGEVDSVCYFVTRIFQGLETSLINSVVKRLTKGKDTLGNANAWRMERLREVNALRIEMMKAVRKEGRILEKDLDDLIKRTLEKANYSDLKKFEGLKESKTDAEQIEAMMNSPALNSMVKKVTKGCKDALNLTATKAVEASARAYTDAVNKAYLSTSLGLHTFKDSVKTAVKEIGSAGINIIERNGTMYTSYDRNRLIQYPLDSAVRRDVVTQLNKSAGELTLETCNELECDLVETTWHLGARHVNNPPHPWSNHDEWQGKIFSISGKSDKYPPFKESTGYGEVDGLCGINCRHSFSPYFEEIGPADHREFPSKEENERHYNEQQKQRCYERNIRQLKREQIAYRAGGYDAEARETQARLNTVTANYKEFLDKTGRTPITALTEISGYHYIKAAGSFSIGKSLSAKAKNYPVKMLDGNYAKFKEGTSITNIHIIAGKGSDKELRARFRLESDYHIPADEWQKKVGQGYVERKGDVKKADLHWYEAGDGQRVEFKVKSYIEEKNTSKGAGKENDS